MAAEQEVRDYTQGIRRKMVEKLMPEDNVPADTDSQRVILTALNDMDKTDIAHKRLKQDDKRINNDSLVADLVTAILKNPEAQLKREPTANTPSIADSIPNILIEGVVPVSGELDIGSHDLTYNSIVNGEQK